MSQSLAEVRRLTNLGSFSVDEVLELFAAATDKDGFISENAFEECFEALRGAGDKLSLSETKVRRQIVDRLYDIFDENEDGIVDFTELCTGLTVLCGGKRDEKAAAAFSLYDYNGDGVISREEMTRYLTSVYKVMYETQAGTAERMGGVSPEELADVTTRQAFVEADVDEDGMMTFEEFQDWYSQPTDNSAGAIAAAVESAPGWVSLGEVRRLTNLGAFTVDEVLELFANATDEMGFISDTDFADCFEKLIGAGPAQSFEDQDKTRIVLSRLYNCFDTNGDGVVDFTELATGLTVLCDGSRDEKAAAAFSLYDYNGDGVISLDEMTRYLTSVFRVMYQAQPGTAESMNGVSPDELADVTARQAFSEADVDEDGMLTFEEFQDWYSTPTDNSAGAIAAAVESAPGWVSLGEVRRLTNLGSFSVDEVLELFANVTDEDGYVSQDEFIDCFHALVSAGPEQSFDDQDKTRMVLSRLYNIFDTNGDGVVDYTELATGLTVLCDGTRDEKAAAAFSLYDYNGDGVISLDEMTRYLTSVFRVMYEAQPGTLERMGGVDADELADATARQAFAEADVDEDGMLTFEEFQDWYSQPTDNSSGALTAATTAAPGWVSLGEVRRLTNLGSFSVDEVLELFANATDSDGYVSTEDFADCFEALVGAGPPQTLSDQDKTRMVLSRLYDIFDTNGDGVVDFTELSTGLTVLCGGTRDEKAAAAFSLYDYNGDGVISLDEMTRYLTSVFKVMYETQPGVATRMGGVSPEELADVTARQAFVEADVDEDGMLTFEEFQDWYSTPTDNSSGALTAATTAAPGWVSLGEVRRLTNLGAFRVDEVLELFANATDDEGYVSTDDFADCFEALVGSGPEQSYDDQEKTRLVLSRLYDLFDTNGDGVVDFTELATGLTVLCGGTRDQKAAAAFSLYDYNGDGVISLDEMTRYLTSVFKVMYETQPGTGERMGGVSPEELAVVTARQAFAEADVDEDGMLTFEEFQDWYSTPTENSSGALTAATDAAPGWVSLGEVRRLTNLGSFSVDEVLELFANATDDEGYVSTQDFADCFEALVGAGPPQTLSDQDKTRMVLSRLYDIFDTNGDGVVDFTELATGLTVLCGGTRDEKAAAAFSLYDYNGDGVISLDEMTRYLTSVFKVMYETQPGTLERMGGVDADELAVVTARQAFAEADVDEDGMLTFEEFQDWYSTPTDNSSGALTAATTAAPGWVSLGEVRRLTNLGSFSVDEVLELFASATDDDGYISAGDFGECFDLLIGAGPGQSDEDQDKTRMVLSRLYDVFDTNGDGIVDFTELATGLTVLCGGTRDEKAAAAFSLYDYNGDGVISLDEMTRYLTSVFKVMYETQPGTLERMGGVSPEDLADVTARHAFAEADVDEDGMLTFEEFQEWYETPTDNSSAMDQDELLSSGEGWGSLGEVRRLTNLGAFSVDEVLELFANATDDEGYVSTENFADCFELLVDAGPDQTYEDQEKTRMVLGQLYGLFDTNGDGVVDFTELATGLTVLCGGTRDEKAAAAFSLYDYNGDGVISLDEMTRYLTSVFKVMYETQPGTLERMGGVSPEELADVTARQAFDEADVDEDGMLTFEEFQDWYSTPTV